MSPNGHLPGLASAGDGLQLSTLTCRHRYNESVAEVVHVLLNDNEYFREIEMTGAITSTGVLFQAIFCFNMK
ncbi:hypothetical protein [Rubinisphaera italica]|uniref:hypothetical protein n=1 Tax=Rubinisphaera italica TaxID=2527969 RepID=UPI0011B65E37|nr:hypothetical protein [Rubinisphaera italica]